MHDLLLSINEWLFANLDDYLTACAIYFTIVCPCEIAIHELGHLYFQKKFGMYVKFVRIGLLKLFTFRYRNTLFKIGLVPFMGDARVLGEGKEWDKISHHPESISYVWRHPKEIVLVAIGGPILSLFVSLVVYNLLACFALITDTQLPYWILIIFWFVWITELSNLLLPIRFSAQYMSDACYALKGLYLWYLWNKKGKRAS